MLCKSSTCASLYEYIALSLSTSTEAVVGVHCMVHCKSTDSLSMHTHLHGVITWSGKTSSKTTFWHQIKTQQQHHHLIMCVHCTIVHTYIMSAFGPLLWCANVLHRYPTKSFRHVTAIFLITITTSDVPLQQPYLSCHFRSYYIIQNSLSCWPTEMMVRADGFGRVHTRNMLC